MKDLIPYFCSHSYLISNTIDSAVGAGGTPVRFDGALGSFSRHAMFLSFTGHAGELCLVKQKSWCDGSVTQVVTASFEEIFLWTVLSIKYSIPEAALIYPSSPLQQPSIPKLHRR